MTFNEYYESTGNDGEIDISKTVASIDDCVMAIYVWESGKTNQWRTDNPESDGYYITDGYLKDTGKMRMARYYCKEDGFDNDKSYKIKAWLPVPDIDFQAVLNTVLETL